MTQSPTSGDVAGRDDVMGRPDQESLHRVCVWFFVLGLVATMLAGNTALLGISIPPQRIFFAIALVLAWGEIVALPGALRFRAVHALMLAVTFWALLSAVASDTLRTSLGFFALVDRLALPFVCFAVAPVVFRSQRDREILLKALILMGLYLGLTAVFEIVGPHQLVFPQFIMDQTLGIGQGRARGPFLASEADGLVMICAAFAGAFGYMAFKGPWRYLSGVVAPLCSLGCLLTLTRSIWLGAIVALAVAGSHNSRIRRHLPLIGASIAVGAAVALLVLPGLHSSVDERAGNARSIQDRTTTNAAAVRMIEANPLTGVGWVRFIDETQHYVRQAENVPITNTEIEAHNVFLGRAAEIGLPGAALWIGCILLGPAAALIKSRRAQDKLLHDDERAGWTLIATAVACSWGVTLFLSPVPYPLPNLLVWLLAGIVVGLNDKTTQT